MERLVMRLIVAALAALTFAACSPAAALTSETNPDIDWHFQRQNSRADGSSVQLQVESHWGPNSDSMWGNDYAVRELQGLSPAQVTGATGPVRFAIVRE